MTNDPLKPKLWRPRPVEETIDVYTDWAETYDKDVTGKGYHTPQRVAEALVRHLKGKGPVLDFGCGTGISGEALKQCGVTPLHGTDITADMLAIADAKQIYEKSWVGKPGVVPAEPGTYRAIVATGVISLGAAPPETLSELLDALAPGGLLALSFNDPTLEDGSYDKVLNAEIKDNRCQILSREHGSHLDEIEMGSDVIVLRRL